MASCFTQVPGRVLKVIDQEPCLDAGIVCQGSPQAVKRLPSLRKAASSGVLAGGASLLATTC